MAKTLRKGSVNVLQAAQQRAHAGILQRVLRIKSLAHLLGKLGGAMDAPAPAEQALPHGALAKEAIPAPTPGSIAPPRATSSCSS